MDAVVDCLVVQDATFFKEGICMCHVGLRANVQEDDVRKIKQFHFLKTDSFYIIDSF